MKLMTWLHDSIILVKICSRWSFVFQTQGIWKSTEPSIETLIVNMNLWIFQKTSLDFKSDWHCLWHRSELCSISETTVLHETKYLQGLWSLKKKQKIKIHKKQKSRHHSHGFKQGLTMAAERRTQRKYPIPWKSGNFFWKTGGTPSFARVSSVMMSIFTSPIHKIRQVFWWTLLAFTFWMRTPSVEPPRTLSDIGKSYAKVVSTTLMTAMLPILDDRYNDQILNQALASLILQMGLILLLFVFIETLWKKDSSGSMQEITKESNISQKGFRADGLPVRPTVKREDYFFFAGVNFEGADLAAVLTATLAATFHRSFAAAAADDFPAIIFGASLPLDCWRSSFLGFTACNDQIQNFKGPLL